MTEEEIEAEIAADIQADKIKNRVDKRAARDHHRKKAHGAGNVKVNYDEDY